MEAALGGAVRQKREGRPPKSAKTTAGKGETERNMTAGDDEWVCDVVSSVSSILCKKTAERMERVEQRLADAEEAHRATHSHIFATIATTKPVAAPPCPRAAFCELLGKMRSS